MGSHAYSRFTAAGSTLSGVVRNAARPASSPSTRSASASAACGSWLVSTRVGAGRPPDQRRDELGGGRVEIGQRLVEEQQARGVEHGAAHREALHHPPRELAHRLVGSPPHPDRVEQLLDALGADAVQPGVVAEVLATAQIAVEQRVVGEQSELPSNGERPPRQRLAEHE